jgi:hypothetical protein
MSDNDDFPRLTDDNLRALRDARPSRREWEEMYLSTPLQRNPWHVEGDDRRTHEFRFDHAGYEPSLFHWTDHMRPHERAVVSQVMQMTTDLRLLPDVRTYPQSIHWDPPVMRAAPLFMMPHYADSRDTHGPSIRIHHPRQRYAYGMDGRWLPMSPDLTHVEVHIAGYHEEFRVWPGQPVPRPYRARIDASDVMLDDYAMLLLEEIDERNTDLSRTHRSISTQDIEPLMEAMRNLITTTLHLIHMADLPVRRRRAWHMVLQRDLLWYAQWLPLTPPQEGERHQGEVRRAEKMLLLRIWEDYMHRTRQ